MCGEIDAHIDRLEAQVIDMRELCKRQRQMLESIFEAWDKWDAALPGYEELERLETAITAARSASTMTGTSEE